MADNTDPQRVRENIAKLHVGSWRGIADILLKMRIFSKWPFWGGLAVCTGLTIFSTFFTRNSFAILTHLTDLITNVFPDMLGFSLGGYAIVVGFSNAELIKRATKVNGYSIYQVISAIFSLIILCQLFTLLFGFIASWAINSEVGRASGIYLPIVAALVNGLLLLVLSFGATYSLAMSSYIVINLFTLSQDNNKFYTLEKYEENQREGETNR